MLTNVRRQTKFVGKKEPLAVRNASCAHAIEHTPSLGSNPCQRHMAYNIWVRVGRFVEPVTRIWRKQCVRPAPSYLRCLSMNELSLMEEAAQHNTCEPLEIPAMELW